MKTFIFIAGAPGSGKSSVAKTLQQKYNSPMFEFGWIPEFRHNGKREITYTEDEALAFENLVLVTKNYAKHHFKNIIITDLESPRIGQLSNIYGDYDYSIFTLRIKDEQVLRTRVTDEARSSEYRDWQEAIRLNQELFSRDAYPNEIFITITNESIHEISESILNNLG